MKDGLFVVIALLLGSLFFANSSPANDSTSESIPEQHIVSGGVLLFERPADFGLAVHSHQLPRKTVIPACDESFDYCLYYLGEDFTNTNFQSAGIRIEQRKDLKDQRSCLVTPPRGYLDFQPTIRHDDGFAISLFEPIQNAATGSYSLGKVFRLALGSNCFEFETRIGASQFAFHEEGTIQEFGMDEWNTLESRLNEVLVAIRLVDRPDAVLFHVPLPN